MSEQSRGHARRNPEPDAVAEVPAARSTSSGQDDGIDSLLDEIDDVLESNAEEFVRSFVQKGGQ